jgi:hypothetical protein
MNDNWKLTTIEDKLYDPKNGIQPCPSCGINEAHDCGYGERDYMGEFDCSCKNKVVEKRCYDCDGCPMLICNTCLKNKEKKKVKRLGIVPKT